MPLKCWLRDPLLHVLALGLLLFGLHALAAPPTRTGDTVRISRATVADMASRYENSGGDHRLPKIFDTWSRRVFTKS